MKIDALRVLLRPEVVEHDGRPVLTFTIALLHVLRLLDSGSGAAPEELALRDHRLQIYGLCWVALFAIGVYAT